MYWLVNKDVRRRRRDVVPKTNTAGSELAEAPRSSMAFKTSGGTDGGACSGTMHQYQLLNFIHVSSGWWLVESAPLL